MRVKSGHNGIYQGREHRLSIKSDNEIKIILDDVTEPALVGFIERKTPYGHIYYKKIRQEELVECYKLEY